MSLLSSWERRTVEALAALQAALARELAITAQVRASRERTPELLAEESAARFATGEAFRAWEREVRN